MIDLRLGDCLAVMATLDPESIDAIVCDPPYALTANKKGGSGTASVNLESPYGRARIGTGNGSGGFMGKQWDSEIPGPETWAAALRVAKPGAHLVAFGGTRTFHRLTCAIEDAGWEIRDCLSWLYGSGFPKSLDVSKAIDKAAGQERNGAPHTREDTGFRFQSGGTPSAPPVTENAHIWEGWGTALKPAWEPIILARKPLGGTVAANVLKHGVGALNIDASRIGYEEGGSLASNPSLRESIAGGNGGHILAHEEERRFSKPNEAGRWPANVVLDEGAAALLDKEAKDHPGSRIETPSDCEVAGNTSFDRMRGNRPARGYDDTGGASRFFYCAKASRAEREVGLEVSPDRVKKILNGGIPSAVNSDPRGMSGGGERAAKNNHPTVKPVDLMRWLVKLVTPVGGLVLDPFMGSGTTGIAAVLERMRFIGIEREAEYLEIAKARIAAAAEQGILSL